LTPGLGQNRENCLLLNRADYHIHSQRPLFRPADQRNGHFLRGLCNSLRHPSMSPEQEGEYVSIEDEHPGSSGPSIADVLGGASFREWSAAFAVGILDDLLQVGVILVLAGQL
jgi:hypothetical protein